MEERNKISLEELTKNIRDLSEFTHGSVDDLREQIRKLWENLKAVMFYMHFYDPSFREYADSMLKDETIIKKVK